MNLADAGARVTMLVRGDALGKTMSDYLVRRIAAHPRIEVRFRSQVRPCAAAGRRPRGGHRRGPGRRGRAAARALFVCIGGRPRTSWAPASGVRTDSAGYILTGPDL